MSESIFSAIIQRVISTLDACTCLSANGRRKEISISDILSLVQETKDSIEPYFANPLVRDWIEANCSDHIAALVNSRGAPSVQLSAIQRSYIYVKVKGYSRAKNASKKESCARCLLAGALYSPNHEREDVLEVLKTMRKPSETRQGVFEVNEESPEFIRRKLVIADQDMPSIAQHRLNEGERENLNLGIPQQASWTLTHSKSQAFENLLQSTLENLRALNVTFQHDKESMDATTTQLVGVASAFHPTRVAVVGGMSDGKSTFISHVLGSPKFLRSGCGSTTSVPTEMVYSPTKGFKATISFVSKDAHQKDIDYYESVKLRDTDEENVLEGIDEDEKLL